MERPSYFLDEMIEGDFKSFRHTHHFKSIENGTIMIDVLDFKSPYAFAGRLFNRLFLNLYLKKFLLKRNETIKEYAETQKWKVILN